MTHEHAVAPKLRAKRAAPPIDLHSFAGEHLFYEVQMFVLARAKRPIDPLEMKFKVEGFALHLKNLLEFFYPSNPEADDVLAADYVTDWDVKRPAMTPLLKNARAQAGRELHHLTVQRATGGAAQKEWAFDDISKELRSVVSAFVGLQPNIPPVTISELLEI